MNVATFDENDWALTPGWATYHRRKPMRRWRLRCWLGRHVWPERVPNPANGYSPSCCDRCDRCGANLNWFRVGQHRYGSLSREVFDDWEAWA